MHLAVILNKIFTNSVIRIIFLFLQSPQITLQGCIWLKWQLFMTINIIFSVDEKVGKKKQWVCTRQALVAVPTPSSSTHRKRKEHFAENRWHSRKIYAPACSVHSLTHGMKQLVLTLFLPREVWLYLPPSAWIFSRGVPCALTMSCLNCNYFL